MEREKANLINASSSSLEQEENYKNEIIIFVSFSTSLTGSFMNSE